jgi:hypothetical protein
MQNSTQSRIGAACGIAFPVALSVGRSSGFMLGALGLTLFVPFLAYVCSALRRAEGDGGWLWYAAFGAGLMGMTLKLASAAPELAYHGIPQGSQTHRALENIAGAATVISLYPFAIFTGIVALQTLRSAVLPRWLGAFAGLTAVALLINGSFRHAGTVPALLLFVIWSFVAGVTLLVLEFRRHPVAGYEPAMVS